jgi:hypothetical protein
VKKAKGGSDRSLFDVMVLENKVLTPSTLKATIAKAGFEFESVEMEAIGRVEKNGDAYAFVARANDRKYALKANDEIKKLVADGKTRLLVRGTVVDPGEKDENGDPKPLVIEVLGAKEPPKDEPKPELPKEEKKQENEPPK